MAEGLFNSKDFKLNALELINSGGIVLDLRNITTEFQIFSDLFSSVMHGNILINDGNDVFNNFFLCGNEFLRVSIDKPGLNKPLEKIFRIYKTTDRRPSTYSGQTYILHFCSEEMILSNSLLVSKAYTKKTTTDIVADILLNYLKVPEKKIHRLEKTTGTYDFIIPNYRPLEAIQWAAGRSYSAGAKFCYFFFETKDGYEFASLQSLYQTPVYKKFGFEVVRSDSDPSKNKDNIDTFNILNDFDVLTSLSNGSYASRLLTVDIFNQNFRKLDYNINKSENQKNLINKYRPFNGLKNVQGNDLSQSFDAYYRTYVAINDSVSERENSIDKWMIPRAMHMSIMGLFKFQIVVPGDIQLKPGMVVTYDFPKFTSADSSGRELDQYRTGKYIVSAVNHKFSEDVHESIVELMADSVSTPFPAAKDGLVKAISKV